MSNKHKNINLDHSNSILGIPKMVFIDDSLIKINWTIPTHTSESCHTIGYKFYEHISIILDIIYILLYHHKIINYFAIIKKLNRTLSSYIIWKF